jgi:hypothetical protein
MCQLRCQQALGRQPTRPSRAERAVGRNRTEAVNYVISARVNPARSNRFLQTWI